MSANGGGVASRLSAPDTGEQGTEVRFSRCFGLRSHRRWRLLRALLAVAPPRLLGGFAGNGRRFRHGPGLLHGFRRGLFAVGSADLGKCRRRAAFRADSACKTAQKFTDGVRESLGERGGTVVSKNAAFDKQYLSGRYGADSYLTRIEEWE